MGIFVRPRLGQTQNTVNDNYSLCTFRLVMNVRLRVIYSTLVNLKYQTGRGVITSQVSKHYFQDPMCTYVVHRQTLCVHETKHKNSPAFFFLYSWRQYGGCEGREKRLLAQTAAWDELRFRTVFRVPCCRCCIQFDLTPTECSYNKRLQAQRLKRAVSGSSMINLHIRTFHTGNENFHRNRRLEFLVP